MNADWMLDVLADLKTFAHDNRLMTLAEQLDDTLLVAAAEIGRNRRRERPGPEDTGHEREAGIAHRRPWLNENP